MLPEVHSLGWHINKRRRDGEQRWKPSSRHWDDDDVELSETVTARAAIWRPRPTGPATIAPADGCGGRTTAGRQQFSRAMGRRDAFAGDAMDANSADGARRRAEISRGGRSPTGGVRTPWRRGDEGPPAGGVRALWRRGDERPPTGGVCVLWRQGDDGPHTGHVARTWWRD